MNINFLCVFSYLRNHQFHFFFVCRLKGSLSQLMSLLTIVFRLLNKVLNYSMLSACIFHTNATIKYRQVVGYTTFTTRVGSQLSKNNFLKSE